MSDDEYAARLRLFQLIWEAVGPNGLDRVWKRLVSEVPTLVQSHRRGEALDAIEVCGLRGTETILELFHLLGAEGTERGQEQLIRVLSSAIEPGPEEALMAGGHLEMLASTAQMRGNTDRADWVGGWEKDFGERGRIYAERAWAASAKRLRKMKGFDTVDSPGAMNGGSH